MPINQHDSTLCKYSGLTPLRGRKGNPNIRDVPEPKHKEIHKSCSGDYYPGGKYNKRADELVKEYGGFDSVTPEQMNEIRRRLIEEFGL